jgi:hypothetical protein
MSRYSLAIGIDGDGEDLNHRSHWSFLIFISGNEVGNLMHVQLLSLEGLVYHFEIQKGQVLNSQSSEGRVFLGHIDPSKYDKVVEIISKEPAPRNNKVKTTLLYVEHITDDCRIVVKTGLSNA